MISIRNCTISAYTTVNNSINQCASVSFCCCPALVSVLCLMVFATTAVNTILFVFILYTFSPGAYTGNGCAKMLFYLVLTFFYIYFLCVALANAI